MEVGVNPINNLKKINYLVLNSLTVCYFNLGHSNAVIPSMNSGLIKSFYDLISFIGLPPGTRRFKHILKKKRKTKALLEQNMH